MSDRDSRDGARLIADRYRLGQRLGGGAMGTVWSGTDELLRRPVAVKEVLLPPGIPDHEADELRERTLREARAIAVVTHPNVVVLYDVAREDDVPFVVMELLPSESLATIVAEHGPLNEAQAALMADAVAAALQAAHRSGVIHRDVKPGNVLICDDGRIKLSDFGISRNVAESTITKTGIMLGTPAFIAPEVVSGQPVTTAADLWGLGATLFAASEGHPPYDTDDDPLATVTSVAQGPVPRPSRPGPISDIVTGLMIKDPTGRLPLDEVRRRLAPLLPDPSARPFSMLLGPETQTARLMRSGSTTPESAPSPPTPPSEPARLSTNPGPLPFTPVSRAGRSPWAVLGLGVAALLLFAGASAGGFTASRLLAGQSVLPRPAPATTSPAPAPPPELVTYADRARHSSDEGAGRFTVTAPKDWLVFHGERAQSPSDSQTVHYVSPDGRTELAVERFGGYFTDGYSLDDYRDALPERAAGTDGQFQPVSDVATGSVDADSGESDHRMHYRTVERAAPTGPGAGLVRTTQAVLMPRSGDLWVVQVTVSGDAPRRAGDLLDAVLGGFRPQQ